MTDDAQPFLDQLTCEQVETLRLVYAHKGSKEIARIMGVSPHTVDQRMRRALKILGVSSRIEAAKILACHGVFHHVTPYQSLRYQPDNLADVRDSVNVALGSANILTPAHRESGAGGSRSSQQVSDDAGPDGEGGAVAPRKIWMLWLVLISVIGIGGVAILYFLLVALAV